MFPERQPTVNVFSYPLFYILDHNMKYQTLESFEMEPNTESDESKNGCVFAS